MTQQTETKMASSWEEAVLAAAKRAGAFDPAQVVQLLRDDLIDSTSEDQLDDVCDQYYHDYPCLFKSRVVDGLGSWTVEEIKENSQ